MLVARELPRLSFHTRRRSAVRVSEVKHFSPTASMSASYWVEFWHQNNITISNKLYMSNTCVFDVCGYFTVYTIMIYDSCWFCMFISEPFKFVWKWYGSGLGPQPLASRSVLRRVLANCFHASAARTSWNSPLGIPKAILCLLCLYLTEYVYFAPQFGRWRPLHPPHHCVAFSRLLSLCSDLPCDNVYSLGQLSCSKHKAYTMFPQNPYATLHCLAQLGALGLVMTALL